MKTVVFITGTNGTGKTSVARALIDCFGGIARTDVDITVCRDERVAFAGKYTEQKYGGVDWLNCTSVLPDLAERALAEHDVLICEGSYLDTHGPNLTKTIFQGDARLIVLLYADADTIVARLLTRSSGIPQFRGVMAKQQRCLRAAAKYASEGCTVRTFDTSRFTSEQIAVMLEAQIREYITEKPNT